MEMANETPETAENKAVKAPRETKEKMVTIKLPLTREEKADVFVSVNERSWLIKRGEEVKVPECVAEVLRNQETALRKAIDFIVANEQNLDE